MNKRYEIISSGIANGDNHYEFIVKDNEYSNVFYIQGSFTNNEYSGINFNVNVKLVGSETVNIDDKYMRDVVIPSIKDLIYYSMYGEF